MPEIALEPVQQPVRGTAVPVGVIEHLLGHQPVGGGLELLGAMHAFNGGGLPFPILAHDFSLAPARRLRASTTNGFPVMNGWSSSASPDKATSAPRTSAIADT